MKKAPIYLIIFLTITLSCRKEIDNENTDIEIKGYDLLNDLKGHWVGTNKTAFGNFDWFTFDFRPISASHLHSIYNSPLTPFLLKPLTLDVSPAADVAPATHSFAQNLGSFPTGTATR
jgi:hypothetical protein